MGTSGGISVHKALTSALSSRLRYPFIAALPQAYCSPYMKSPFYFPTFRR